MSTDKINFNISLSNNNNIFNRNKNSLTLNKAIDLIKSKNYESFVENELIEMIKKQPTNSYEMFFKNILIYLQRIERKNNGKEKS